VGAKVGSAAGASVGAGASVAPQAAKTMLATSSRAKMENSERFIFYSPPNFGI
jgi:hypothetical protein